MRRRARTPLHLPAWAALGLALSLGGGAAAHEVSRPEAVRAPLAPWPAGMAAAHDVVVPVTILVGEDGRVVSAEVEAPVHPALDAAALRTARSFLFRPATKDGAPVAARVRAVVRFAGDPHLFAHDAGLEHAHAGHDHAHPPPPRAPQAASGAAEGAEKDPRAVDVRVRGERALRSSESTIERDVIQATRHASGSEVLRTVPGVAITQHGGQGKAHQIFFRGFDAEHGQDVEVFVGGAPVNEVSNLHGQGFADLHFVLPEVIRRVRARPGTYDPRQGEFAIAGSLELDLGLAEPGVHASGTLGSFGERRLFLAYRPADAPEETFAAAEVQGTDGFGPSRAAERGSVLAQALVDASDRTRVRVLGSAYGARHDAAGVLPLSLARARDDSRYRTLDPDQGGDASRLSLVLEIEDDGLEEGDHLVVAPYLVHRTLRLRQNYTGWLEDPVGGDGTEQTNDSFTFGLRSHYEKRLRLFDDRDAIAVGVAARGDLVDQAQKRLSSVNDAPTAVLVDASLAVVDTSAWAELAAHPVRPLTVRAGVRVDGIHAEATDQALDTGGPGGDTGPRRGAFGVHVGPKASAELAVWPWLRPFVAYGEGFRGRQVRSLSNGEDAPFVEVRSGELGVRTTLDRLEATVSGFHTYLEGDLVFDPVLARNEPVGPTRRTGFAAELALRPTAWMVHASSVTFSHASFAEDDGERAAGDLVPYAPQLVGRSDLSLVPTIARLWERDLTLRAGLGLSILASRPLPYGELGSDVFLADASAGARLGEVEMRVDATNLLDAAYHDGQFVFASQLDRDAAPSLVPQRHVTVGPPLAVFGTLALHL